MKILNVNMSLDPVTGGGTVERTIQLSKNLASVGVECTILSLDTNLDRKTIKSLIDCGVKIRLLRCKNKRFFLPELTFHKIDRLVEENDLVHLMNHWTAVNAIVYLACRKLNRPYVVCPAGALPIFGRSRFLKKIYNLFIGKRIIRNASGHIAIPKDEAEQFEPYGIPTKKICIIPNGINPDDFKYNNNELFREKYSIGHHPFILFLGRLNRIKGPDILLHAFTDIHKKFTSHHLVFAGPDDGMLQFLNSIVEKNRLKDVVHFIGYVSGKDKSRAFHSADLLAITSRQEAMSIVALEAGCAGTPVLMTNICGFNKIDKIGGGIIVEPTVKGVRNGLIDLLRDEQRLKKMGRELNRFILDNYTWDVIVKHHIRLFKKVLSSSPKK